MIKYCFLILFTLSLLQGCVSASVTGGQLVYDRYNVQKKLKNNVTTVQLTQHLQSNEQIKTNSHISVATTDRVILLIGQAANNDVKDIAEFIATQENDGRQVINNITIGNTLSRTAQLNDALLTGKVKSKIIASGKMDPDNIKVVTEDKVVYLLGQLPPEQADIAIHIARGTKGVSKVVNGIDHVLIQTG